MDNRALALGFTAVAAVAVAGVATRAPPGPSAAPPSRQETAAPRASDPGRSPAGERGEDLLHQFFGAHWRAGSGVAPDTFDLNIVIATLPDPYDSHLDWSFDAQLESMRRAFETAGYVTDRFWLPGPRDSTLREGGGYVALREVRPGVMLFRHGNPAAPKLQMLFLVPELPTRGVYKQAMQAALEERHRLLRHADLPLRPDRSGPVRIIGPTFSGSSLSLQFALRAWRAQHPRDSIRLVSGTATSFANLATLDRPDLGISFRATVNPDQRLDRLLAQVVLPRLGLRPSQVALLQESSTQYGQALLRTEPSTVPDLDSQFVVIPVPMSISTLRSEYQRAPGGSPSEPALPGAAEPPRLPLDLLDPIRPKEDLPLTSRLSPLALDLILDDLARTISRRRIRLVGLLATDVRDKLFLGQEIRRRVRDVQFFTYESNILYLRSDRNQTLRGMLVLSTYPLILENQWRTSDQAETRRFAFGSDAAQGVYNATLTQLDSTRLLLDYRPLSARDTLSRRPPVWLTTVGAGTFLPVSAFPDTTAEESYLASGCPAGLPCASPPRRASGAARGEGPVRRVRLPFLPLAAMMITSFGLIALAAGSLVADRRVRSHLSGLTGIQGVDPRPVAEQVIDGSLRLHERLYTLLRILAVAGIFLAACGPGLRLMVTGRLEGSFLLLTALAAVTAGAALLALMSGLWSMIMLLRRYGSAGWEYFFRGPFRNAAERWNWRLEVLARGLVGLFGLLYLALAIGFNRDALFLGDPSGFWLFFRRASEIDSLVSPILPLMLAGLGYAIWCTWHLQRIELLRNHTTFESALELELGSEPASRVSIGSALRDDLRRSARAARLIRARLFQVIPSTSSIVVLAAFLCLTAWLWPQFGRSLEALVLEDAGARLPYFDWLFRLMLLAALLATAWGATRLLVVWQGLKQCLDGFARTPIVIAFERLPPRLARLTRLTLPRGETEPVGILADVQWLHLQRIHAARADEFARSLEPENPRLVRQIAELMRVPAAQTVRLDTLGRSALMARFGALHDVLRELWRLEPMPEDVQTMTQALAKDFEKPAVTGPDASTTLRLRRGFAGPVRLWLRAGEEYAVTVMVEYVEWVIRHLRVLALFMLLSLLLTTLLVSSYPYPPQSLLRLVLLVVLVATVGALVVVLAQMNRNEVLSRIARTEPGKVTWNTTFVLNLITFGGLPLITLLSSEFPELRQLLFAWAAPLLRTVVQQ